MPENWFRIEPDPDIPEGQDKRKGEPSTVADERPPRPDELRAMLHAGDLRAKTSIAIVSRSLDPRKTTAPI